MERLTCMRLTLTLSALLLVASPVGAGTLQIWEDSLGSPGSTAVFPYGTGLLADLDFDADSAEGGSGLPFGGPSEIDIQPTGNLVFVAFTCQLAGCTENVDYVFTPGGAGTGALLLSDPNFANPETGIFDIGLLEFDILSGLGTMELLGCNYSDGSANEQTCDPFTLVTAVPEPSTGLLLAAALGGLGLARRRR